MGEQTIPVYVINLDRRPDRLAFMTDVLAKAGVQWHRVSALDAQVATDADIAKEVQLTHPRVGMGRGSQCCAITNFDIFRKLASSKHPAALIMQDDVAVAPQLAEFLTDLDWLHHDIGLVQFEKFGRPYSRRLAGPRIETGRAGRGLHPMYSRTAGAGCFLITKWAAQEILARKPILDMPIDHFLFSPNVSPVFKHLGVGFVTPALAVQRMEDIASDLSADRKTRKKTTAQRLRRLGQEINRVPSQLWATLRGARMIDFGLPPELTRPRKTDAD